SENRARTEIAKLVQITVEQSESKRSKSIKTRTAVTLSGILIVDWYNDNQGTIFALAAMPRLTE
ncbi:MAG: hypothetical protein V3T05_00430, partial [Myxococcota bacterium]